MQMQLLLSMIQLYSTRSGSFISIDQIDLNSIQNWVNLNIRTLFGVRGFFTFAMTSYLSIYQIHSFLYFEFDQRPLFIDEINTVQCIHIV